MMNADQQKSFNAEKVGDIAKRIEATIAEIEKARERKKTADSELGSQETRLMNLRIELTRAIDGQLDMSTLKQQPARSFPS